LPEMNTRTTMRAAVIVLSLSGVFGQSKTDRPAFEVASIKPGDPSSLQRRVLVSPGGRLNAENASLRRLIEEAYQLKPFQLSGGPRWMDSEAFTVVAKGDDSANSDQTRLMIQSLLAERFQVTIHRETKEQTLSLLIVKDKDKLKLRPAKEAGRFGVGTQSSGRGATSNHVEFRNTSMARLADMLTREMGHMVEDQTGLTGEFDFEFDATHDEAEPNPFIAPYAPALSQIGLKLESRKGLVDFIVVDHAEKPSQN
jgi:uncharacterized protein (TIGR03435 family)